MTAAAAVMLMLALPAEAQWKWKDKGGRVQYSDLPPPAGTPDADILTRPAAPQQRRVATPAPASAASGASAVAGGNAPPAPRPADPELEARRKAAEAEKAAKGKAEDDRIAAAKAENCTRAKGNLRDLDSGIRITRSNDKGEREYLDDKQRADEAKRARDIVAADCK